MQSLVASTHPQMALQPGAAGPAQVDARQTPTAGGAGTPAAAIASTDPQVLEWLAQARWAIQAGRLTEPREFNAREYYQQVLEREPGNAEARRGLQKVLELSITASLRAAQQGNYKQAELHLTRAGKFALNDPGIQGARRYVHRLSRTGRKEFALAHEALRAEDAEQLEAQLAAIVRAALEHDAHIEILVPEDAQGLWVFEQLQQFAGEAGLRATIRDAAQPRVRLSWRR